MLRISIAVDCPSEFRNGHLPDTCLYDCTLKSTILHFSVDMFGSRLLGKRTFVWADGTNAVAIKSKTVLNSISFFTRAL